MIAIARRTFLATLGAAGLAAPAILRAQGRGPRHRIAFSTLGCPAWTWKTILDTADRLGYAGLELRGVAGEMDLPKVPELQGTRLAATRKDLASLGIVICDLGASATMHEKDPAARQKQFDEGRRFIDLAHALGVRYVRMFGDKVPPEEPKEEVM
jgi:sugar phosphate isomerase/epimerase